MRAERRSGGLFGVLAMLSVVLPASATAATIVRGPYLQRTSTTAAVLRWRTDAATDTWAGWGEVAGVFDQTASSSALTTEHVVAVAGLAAKTLYYYAVGTTTTVLAGGDATHHFRTAPAAGDPDAQHLWVIGDCGATSLPLCAGPATNNAALVRDGYLGWMTANAATPDLWLMLGDNAYCSGTDAEFQMAIF
ncbi:MAG: fibronectin type III domain-containing protein, partial [Thermoanaerobaculia bacterium]